MKYLNYIISALVPIYGWILWARNGEGGKTCGIIASVVFALALLSRLAS